MVIKYFILLFLLFSSLSASPDSDFREARHKITHSVLRKFKRIMQAKGFYAAGIGEGVDPSGKQNCLKLVFDIDELPSVDYARRIEIETIQEFLKCINSQTGIENYVAEYPYPIRFVDITFISRHPEKGLFSVWNNGREELIYDDDNREKPIGPLMEVHRESYEDAVRILAQQNDCSQRK